jgi:hypothetical protein
VSETDQQDPIGWALAALDGLDERPVVEHVAVFEQVHSRLREALAGASSDAPAAGSTSG